MALPAGHPRPAALHVPGLLDARRVQGGGAASPVPVRHPDRSNRMLVFTEGGTEAVVSVETVGKLARVGDRLWQRVAGRSRSPDGPARVIEPSYSSHVALMPLVADQRPVEQFAAGPHPAFHDRILHLPRDDPRTPIRIHRRKPRCADPTKAGTLLVAAGQSQGFRQESRQLRCLGQSRPDARDAASASRNRSGPALPLPRPPKAGSREPQRGHTTGPRKHCSGSLRDPAGSGGEPALLLHGGWTTQ